MCLVLSTSPQYWSRQDLGTRRQGGALGFPEGNIKQELTVTNQLIVKLYEFLPMMMLYKVYSLQSNEGCLAPEVWFLSE